MNAWLDANADGIALLLIFGLLGVAFVLIAFVVEWRMEPRADRGEFRNLARNRRGRQAMATEDGQ